MGSVFQDLATVAEEEPVLFNTLDLTNRSSRQQAQYLTSLLGLSEVWQSSGEGARELFAYRKEEACRAIVFPGSTVCYQHVE